MYNRWSYNSIEFANHFRLLYIVHNTIISTIQIILKNKYGNVSQFFSHHKNQKKKKKNLNTYAQISFKTFFFMNEIVFSISFRSKLSRLEFSKCYHVRTYFNVKIFEIHFFKLKYSYNEFFFGILMVLFRK